MVAITGESAIPTGLQDSIMLHQLGVGTVIHGTCGNSSWHGESFYQRPSSKACHSPDAVDLLETACYGFRRSFSLTSRRSRTWRN